MKKLLSIIALTLTGLSMMAKPVEPEKVVQVAKNFMAQYLKGADKMEATVVYTHLMPKSGQPAMYVVNLGHAFVIISADDVAHPVLGYSLSRPWPVQGERSKVKGETSPQAITQSNNQALAPQVAAYLDDLASQIEAASSSSPNIGEVSEGQRGITSEWHQLLTEHLTLTTNLPDSVGPLLTTTWDQGQYYNALCPEDAAGPAGHALTGCVATAMAQIINYWGYPVHGRGTHSYNHDTYGTLIVNYDSATYDYAHMSNALTATSTPQEINAVATLMRDCGVAANMSYGPNESSSYDIDARAGLINFFRLSPNLSYAEKSSFADSVWENMLRTDISANHPIMYSGYGDNGGHSFVCDGYRQDGFFHYNFGWSGYADGWYLTSAINPAGMAFNSDQSAILGIIPDSTGNVILGQMKGNSFFTVDSSLELYDIMGHNTQTLVGLYNFLRCNSTVSFVSSDTNIQIVLDVLSFCEHAMAIYDGIGTTNYLAWLTPNSNDIQSPLFSTQHAVTVQYEGNLTDNGFCFQVQKNSMCRAVSSITSIVDSTTIILMWNENGNSSQWEIEYGLHNFIYGEGISIITDTTTLVINNLIPYEYYDFYFRPICQNHGKKQSFIIANYWNDVVNQEPDGYYDDGNGNIHVSTAEGLAWWAKQVDGASWIVSDNLFIDSDINLSGKLWRPIHLMDNNNYGGVRNINGQGHIIENMKIIEPETDRYHGYGAAFISEFYGDTIQDLTFKNPIIVSKAEYTGVLAGRMIANQIINCGVINGNIDATSSRIGGLVGELSGCKGLSCEGIDVINCFTNCEITSSYGFCFGTTGGLFGLSRYSTIKNSYSASPISNNIGWYGGISGTSYYDTIINSYKIIQQYNDYVEASSLTQNYCSFRENNTLFDNLVVIDGISCSNLITALNIGVECENEGWRMWVPDTNYVNGGYPIFGNNQDITCPNVEGLSASNLIVDGENTLRLSWNSTDEVSSWLIKYYDCDSLESTAIQLSIDTNVFFIQNMSLGVTYKIFVKPLCNDTSVGGWGNGIVHLFELPYWTDVVTSLPAGYSEDVQGNVYISTAEGLAWLASCVNGLNSQIPNSFEGKRVTILSNIDLAGYRWMPIGLNHDNPFSGNVNGGNNIIFNAHINENNEYVGLFGFVYLGKFSNVILQNAVVRGVRDVGGLCGRYTSGYGWFNGFLYDDVFINNCHSLNCNIYGIHYSGGILGYTQDLGGIKIMNCSSSGNIYCHEGAGGIIGQWHTGSVFGYEGGQINNCYSSANINDYNGAHFYAGGLVAYSEGSVQNCYSVGIINTQRDFTGQVLGVLDAGTASYLYGSNNSSLPLIGDLSSESMANNTSTFFSTQENLVLTQAVTIGETSYTNLLSALNAWVDANDTAGIYRHWVADTANINGGFPVFAAPQSFILTLNVDENTPYGSVSGGGLYSEINREATIVAIPQEHYHFVQWNDGNTDNPRTVVMIQDTSFIAKFEADIYSIVGTANAGISFSYDFESPSQDNQWTLQNDSFENQWHIGSLNNTNRALFISNDNGVSNNYTINNAYSYVFAHTDLFLDAGQYNYSYDWRCNAEQNYDYLRVALLPATTALNFSEWSYSALPYVSIALDGGYQLVQQSNWTTQSGIVDVPFDGEYKLMFYWTNDGSAGNMPPAAIDNVQFSSTVIVEGHGVVLGSDTVPYLDTVTLTAIPDEGYHFMQWNDGNTDNPRIVIATENVRYVALFEIDIPIGSDTITVCDSYTWHGNTYTTSGSYYDGTDTLILTVNHSSSGDTTATACESYFFGGQWLYASGQYTDTTVNVVGCDSVTTLNLTINNPVHTAVTETACDSYTWNGALLTTSGNYTYPHNDANGCTQVDTLHLTINYSTSGDTTATACDNFSWWSANYTNSTDEATHVYTNIAGCDSTVTLHLTINHSVETTVTDTAEGSYIWNGTTYTESGTYTWTGTTAEGCDSTVTLLLTISPTQAITQSSIQAIKIYPNPTSGLLTIEAEGILSMELFDLNGRQITPFTHSRNNALSVDLSGVPAGSYLLRIHTQWGNYVQHVIKN